MDLEPPDNGELNGGLNESSRQIVFPICARSRTGLLLCPVHLNRAFEELTEGSGRGFDEFSK